MAETVNDSGQQLEVVPEDDQQEFVDAVNADRRSGDPSQEENDVENRKTETNDRNAGNDVVDVDKAGNVAEKDAELENDQQVVKVEIEDDNNEALDGEDDELEDGQDMGGKGNTTENDDQLSDTLDSGQEENEREIMLNSKGMEDDEEEEDKKDYSDSRERILLAAENGEEDVVLELLSTDPSLVNIRDGDSYTPLHRACYNNNVEVIKVLLSHGADVSAKTEELWEPLHCACKWDNVEAASLLIHNGANVNAVSKGGLTPLHLAAANKNGRRTIELLMWHPYIDATLKNTAGDTAYDIAYRSGPVAGLFEILEDSINVC